VADASAVTQLGANRCAQRTIRCTAPMAEHRRSRRQVDAQSVSRVDSGDCAQNLRRRSKPGRIMAGEASCGSRAIGERAADDPETEIEKPASENTSDTEPREPRNPAAAVRRRLRTYRRSRSRQRSRRTRPIRRTSHEDAGMGHAASLLMTASVLNLGRVNTCKKSILLCACSQPVKCFSGVSNVPKNSRKFKVPMSWQISMISANSLRCQAFHASWRAACAKRVNWKARATRRGGCHKRGLLLSGAKITPALFDDPLRFERAFGPIWKSTRLNVAKSATPFGSLNKAMRLFPLLRSAQ